MATVISGSTGITLPDNGSLSTSVAGAMVIDSAGRVTKPLQPSATVSWNSASYSTQPAQWIMTTAHHNTGNHYSTTNGRFTCPVSGVYSVSMFTLSDTAADLYYAVLYKNGTIFAQSFGSRGNKVHILVYATAGDYLSVGSTDTTKNFYQGPTHSEASFYLLG